jgi:hypothetical protein
MGGAELSSDDGAPVARDVGCAIFPGDPGNIIHCGGGSDVRITSNGTLMAWANPIDAARTEYAASVAYDDDADRDGPGVGTHVGVRGGKMATWVSLIDPEANAKDREYDSGEATIDVRQHLAFTFGGDVATPYVNGEEVVAHDDRDGMIGLVGDRSEIAIGEPYGAKVDGVALYSGVLSSAEVMDVMSKRRP